MRLDDTPQWTPLHSEALMRDEPALEALDEGLAMRVAGYHWKRLEPLLAKFRIVSDDTLAFLRGLSASDWARAGRRPALGRVTIRILARRQPE
jgi:hypothetical protein